MITNLLTSRAGIYAILSLLAWAMPGLAEAALYKCLDKHHHVLYQDKPCQAMSTAKLSPGLSKISGTEEVRAFFWQAKGGRGTVYLLGSLHFGTPALFPLPNIVGESFRSSNVLVVEADITRLEPKQTAQLLQGKGHYNKPDRLEDHLRSATWQKTLEQAGRLGLEEENLQTLEPWLAALALTELALKRDGYQAEYGIDRHFIQQAQGKMPVMELENVEEQISLFDELTGQEQEQMLLQTLQELSQGKKLYQSIMDAWKKGDADSMDFIIRQSFDAGASGAKLFRLFFLERNERMANRIMELSNDGRVYFVVVGAGHLAGSQGLLNLLEQKGMKITQP